MDDKERITILENRVKELEEELNDTKKHLKRYTAPSSRQRYYQNHKQKEKIRAKEYRERTNYKYERSEEQKQRYYENLKIKRKEKKEAAQKLKESLTTS